MKSYYIPEKCIHLSKIENLERLAKFLDIEIPDKSQENYSNLLVETVVGRICKPKSWPPSILDRI